MINPGECDLYGALGFPRMVKCEKTRALTDADRRAVSRYEALETDPWATGVWLDEDGKERRGSVAHLLRWREAPWKEARDVATRTLRALHDDGIIVDSGVGGAQPPPPEGHSAAHRALIARWGGLDTRYADPTQFLAWPKMDRFQVPRPTQVPATMPIPRNIRPVWITSKALDPRGFPRDRLIDAITTLASACADMSRYVNSNPALDPAHSFGLGYPQEIGGDNPPLDASVQVLKGYLARGITAHWRDYWTRVLHKCVLPPSVTEDPASATFRVTGPSDPVWNTSERERVKVYANRGSDGWQGDHLVSDCADAVMDLNEMCQLTRFKLDLGPTSTFYSAVQYHKELYERSRQRLGITRNVSPTAYIAMLHREQQKRQRRGLANAAALLTQGQYALSDSDGVGDVIAKGSVATLAAGVTVATAAVAMGATALAATGVGAVVAAVMVAVAILVGFLSSDTPTLTPDRHWPLDNPGVPSQWDTNAHYWYAMGDVLTARPVIDWRPA